MRYLESEKIILSFVNGSDLDISILDYSNGNYYSWTGYLRGLDFVQDAEYRISTTFLTFETEQDKMFFILKYA